MKTLKKRLKKGIFYTTIFIGMSLLFLSLYFSYKGLSDLNANKLFITNAVEVFNQTARFGLINKEAQANVREYMLTRDKALARRVDQASVELKATCDTLKLLLKNNPDQTRRVQEITSISDDLLHFLKDVQQTYETKGTAPAVLLIQSGRGRFLFESLKEKIEEIDWHESLRLRSFETEFGQTRKETIYYTIGTAATGMTGFCITLLWLYYLFLNRKKHHYLRSELHRKERLQHQYLEAIPDGVIVVDTAQRVSFINQSGKDMLGIREEEQAETLKQLIAHIPFTNPEEQMALLHSNELPLTKGLRGQRSIGNRFDILRHGNLLNFESNVQPIYDLNDEIIGAVCVIRDITEKQAYADNLKVERDLVARSVRVRDIFLSNISHEIRTPLNTIIGFTELLKQEAREPFVAEHIGYIQMASKNLLMLINDILDISKMEVNQVVLDMEPTSISELINSVSILISKKAVDKGIHYHQKLHEGLPATIITDKLRLTQILVNLCDNAVKFTERGHVTLDVSPAGPVSGGQQLVRFVVQDSGIGIPADKQEQVFDRFMQASSERTTQKFGGTGLGLSIVKALVKLFNGKLELESKEGVGTTFTLEFPFNILEDFEQGNTPEPVDVAPELLSNLRILAAEDNPLNQKLLSAIFNKIGTELVIVNNGQEALDQLSAGSFDLIIMDVQMPVMDGYTAIRKIRNKLKLKTPIITMTAHAMAGEREEGLRIGANSYLSKPFQKQELFSVIISLTQKMAPSAVQQDEVMTAEKQESPGIVDFGYLQEMTGGNDTLRQELIDLFENEGIKQYGLVKSAMENRNYDELRSCIHKFRSSLFSIGLLASANRLKLLETELIAKRIPPSLEQSILDLETEIKAGLKELKERYY